MNPIAVSAVGGIIGAVGNVLDDLVTTDKERMDAQNEPAKIGASWLTSQMDVNKAEAGHASTWVAGWRPACGWVGAAAMAYQFLLYPFMVWAWALMQAKGWIPGTLAHPPMPAPDALLVILTGMLGIAGARTFEKVKGVSK